MNWIIKDFNNILIILCGLFYSILCIFSIVTGIIYMSGKRKLNPLELSEEFVSKLDTPKKLKEFTIKMGKITFIVGLIQGLTAFSLFKGYSKIYYYIALSFTIFSICSVLIKLKNKINLFPIIKLLFYVAILIIILIPSSRILFNM